MKIISIGMIPGFSYVEDYAKAHSIEHINVMDCYQPEDIFSTVLREEYDYIFIDLDLVDGTTEEIIDFFAKLRKATAVPIIIGASKFVPEADIIIGIKKAGINKFIFSDILFNQKAEFAECMENEKTSQEERIPDGITMDDMTETELTVPDRGYITIGVISKNSRIGTTTLAIQLVKYLEMLGYKSCYIQHNDSFWVQNFDKWIDGILHDIVVGKVVYQNVDMYYNIDRINAIRKMGYDVYVYDYGVDHDKNISFLERDIRIGIAGSSPSEMDNTQELIETYYDEDVLYCFNFVPQSEREEILGMMNEYADKTFFIDECPDPFFLSSANLETYKSHISIEEKDVGKETEAKKKRFFLKK